MSEWKTYKLGELPILFIDGDRGKNYPKGDDFSEVGHCLFLNAGNVTKNGWNFDGNVYISEEKDNLLRNGKLERGDIVLTTRGTVGNVVLYSDDIPYKHIRINSGMVIIRNNNTCYNPYLYQYLRSYSFFKQVQQFQSGSAQPQIPISTLKKLTISLPPLAEQKRIADILSAIDDKIELNRRINANLEQQAQALYKSWFVDNKKDDWEKKRLDDIISIYDSQRKPLSGQQREKMEKIYPYYGAASLMDYVDNYLFDGIYLLLGEDGTVSDSEGFPMLQYVWGKFWVNNHAHILQGKNGFTTESLYILLKQTNVSSIVTGAVQPKISQANLKSVPIIMPPINLLNQYNDIIKPLFDQIRTNHNQIQQLSTLRDTLLPKLMNGEITV